MKERKMTGYPSLDRVHLEGVPEAKLHPKVYPYSMLAAYTAINDGHWDEPLLEQGGRKYLKGDFRDATIGFAAALLGLGIVSGAKIAIATRNCTEGVVATFGANAIGVAVIMVEPTFETNPERFYEEVRTHQPTAVLIEKCDLDIACKILATHDITTRLIVVGDDESYAGETISFGALSTFKIAPDLVAGEIKKYSLASDDDPILYLKTSGSTSGVPKTLPFTNLAIFAAMMFASCSTGTKTRDETSGRALCSAPFQHGYGWMPLFVNLIGGNEVVLVGSKVEDVAKYYTLNPGRIYGSPLTLRQMVDSTPKDADLSLLTKFFCAGAAISLGCGDNTYAALLTRGLAEIARLGEKVGAKRETFFGLTGLGDLIVTCGSEHSRNRKAGKLVGQGMPLDEVKKEVGMVIESIDNIEAAYALKEKYNVEMPIVDEVYNVLYNGEDPKEAVFKLMQRDKKAEME